MRPPLTTVRFPHYQLGTEAAQLLLERIGQRDAPVKILYLAPELVVRESAAAPGRLGREAGDPDAGGTVRLTPVPLSRAPSRRAGGASRARPRGRQPIPKLAIDCCRADRDLGDRGLPGGNRLPGSAAWPARLVGSPSRTICGFGNRLAIRH